MTAGGTSGMEAGEGSADLFYLQTPAPPQHHARYLAWLSQEEQERFRRFRFEPDRQVFLAAHALVRWSLGQAAGVAPESLEFQTGKRGKPFVRPGTPASHWHFNLSHTRGLVACGLSRAGALGVDVERIDTKRNVDGVARRVLSQAEQSDWEARSGTDRAERFFRYWTLKEAYIKALGLGLDQPLGSVTFTIAEDGTATVSGRPDASEWRLRTYETVPGYLISVAWPASVTVPLALQSNHPLSC
jgi:4'-phosphopantetheinyl transferase